LYTYFATAEFEQQIILYDASKRVEYEHKCGCRVQWCGYSRVSRRWV